MKVQSGLDVVSRQMPSFLRGRKPGLLCHASSITSDFRYITDVFSRDSGCAPGALFGPQHGIFGQTQDNMIEWEGSIHPVLGIPVYSLYGEHRKPTPRMLEGLDSFVVDLQDVGARLYTYIWTVKLCLEACAGAGIPVYILDRPNPIGRLQCDGPVLKNDFFTFVGGAEIPMCHRMTIGEMALWIRDRYQPDCNLKIIAMECWKRDSLFRETGLPWVLPSPNMPTPETTLVYPGTVLAEALNLSEGRGTVIPFELTGAPYINGQKLLRDLRERKLPGCAFRIHDFIPTFNKYAGQYCRGIQIHVTDPHVYRPVATALHLFNAIMRTSTEGSLTFNPPPYEYEYRLMPFDILSGDSRMREVLQGGSSLSEEISRWDVENRSFTEEFREIAIYKE
jgi:uncharacterized protein YbbC (DUF1343 family)